MPTERGTLRRSATIGVRRGPGPGDVARLRLLQLVSPALPVGAYAYSEGLEYAVAASWIRDEADARSWIVGRLNQGIRELELPAFRRLYEAWSCGDQAAVRRWTQILRAFRESAELRTADERLGAALARLLDELGIPEAAEWASGEEITFATFFALAASRWAIPLRDAAQGLAWAWAENQVACAVKLVPLGQTAGQRILLAVGDRVPEVVEAGLALPDEAIGALAPGLAIASARHETQYSRLFRS